MGTVEPVVPRSRIVLALVSLAAALVLGVVTLRGGGTDRRSGPPPPGLLADPGLPASDPLAWTPARSPDYERRAAAGYAHVIYAKVPAGIVVSADRVRRLAPVIERAAQTGGADPKDLAAIVLVESAGNPEAQASDDLRGAVGLTQILAETGQNLLGMRVDLEASRSLTKRILRARRRGQDERVRKLVALRRAADERWDPRKSLAATARYLAIARGQLGGREDLAVAGYHMGIGNLMTALARYGAGNVPYAQLYFDSTPLSHASAWRFLAGLGDDSATYLWRVRAARDILALSPEALDATNKRQTARNSAEEVLHPPGDTDVFDDPDSLRDAYATGSLVALPVGYLAAHGLRIDRAMGELADRVGDGATPGLYRGLGREALAAIGYVGAWTQRISASRALLNVTSTVRDTKYQQLLDATNPEAVSDYSLHTTGFTFDIARDYGSRAQAMTVQFLLDRLTALNLIAWVREPGAIHVTVAGDAARLQRPLGIAPAP